MTDNKQIFKTRKNFLEGFIKTSLTDHKGRIILPRTTSSMVSEEPERRFIDSEEKAMIYELTANKDNLLSISKKGTEIIALADRSQDILNMIDFTEMDWQSVSDRLEAMEPILFHKEEILDLVENNLFAFSPTTSARYFITVDDSNPDDVKLALTIDDTKVTEPIDYVVGDTWEVSNSASDVKIDVPLMSVHGTSNSPVILTFDEALAKKPDEKDIINVNNGLPFGVKVSDTKNIAQMHVLFDVEKYIKEQFPKEESIMELINGFDATILMKPDETGTVSRSQMFRDKEYASPIRSSINKNAYEEAKYSNILWSVTHDDKWLNNKGVAGIVVYGSGGHGIYSSRPSLTVRMTNPYKGKKLRAIKPMGEKFNILDWTLVEE